MNEHIFERIAASIRQFTEKGLLRTVPRHEDEDAVRIDLSTNSYLCLHTNPVVASEALRLSRNMLAGNHASRLIATQSPLYELLERKIARWKHAPHCLVFNSGYAANTGILGTLATRNSVILSDRHNHASIVDGILLSRATCVRYNHCDMDDLDKKLKSITAPEKIIVTDTVFSMDGDRAPLESIVELAERYRCMIVIDEAHALGIFGATGGGLAEALNLEDAVDIQIGTLSKAVAGLGGFFTGSKMMYDFFVNTCRTFIYSTALPHSILSHNCAAIEYISNHPPGGAILENAQYLKMRLQESGFDTANSSTHIVPCVLYGEQEAMECAALLKQEGIKVPAVRPPTVPRGTSRLRFSIHTHFTKDNADEIVSILKSWKKRRYE